MTTSEKNRADRVAIRTDLLWLMLGLLVIAGATCGLAAQHGAGELRAAIVAAAIVGQSALLSYLITVMVNSPAGALASVGLRSGLPMAALVLVAQGYPGLAEAGFGGYLLACYLPALALETTLAARRIAQLSKSDPSSHTGDSADSPQAV